MTEFHTERALDEGQAPAFYLTEEHHPEGSTMLGFWLYLMSDCLIFAVLFATHAVLAATMPPAPRPPISSTCRSSR